MVFSSRKAWKVMPQMYNPIHPLPAGFAQHILDIEMQFEDNPSVPLLNALMTLYSVSLTQAAIEYYEALSDPKYCQFKERLHGLLSRKDVLRLLEPERPSSACSIPAPDPTEESTPFHRSLRRRKSEHGTSTSLHLPELRDIEVIVNDSQTCASTAGINVQADIQKQNTHLQLRLRERVKTMSRLTSPDSSRSPRNRSYETELEAILEKYLLEKQKQVATVKSQFDLQICEIEALAKKSQNGLLYKVISEMKKSQESALSKIETDLFHQKQEEINSLRRKWLK